MIKGLRKIVIGILLSLFAACVACVFLVKNVGKAQDVISIPSFQTKVAASIRLEEPYGIRFLTEISATDYAKLPESATFGTLIIPTSLLDGKLELSTPRALNIETKVWQRDVGDVKSYNGVLVGNEKLNFDEKYYAVSLSACGYVTYVDSDEITHTIYSDTTVNRSVAEVAALSLKGGGTAEILTDMVDYVVSSVSFTNADTVYLAKGGSFTATISGNEGLTAVFSETGDISLSNETDNTVLVTGDEAGEATLTATLGSRTDTINVIVKDYEISSNIESIRGIVGDEHTMTATVTEGGEEVESGTATFTANALEATIDGDTITPLVSGDIDVTVTYTDANGVAVNSVYTLSANTVNGYLAETLTENKLVNWSDELWSRKISDTAISSKSMSYETYTPVLNTNEQFYAYVPVDSRDGTGRTITFPVQNTYTDGYVKITVTKQSGTFPGYAHVDIYKIGETNASNYVLRATGANILSGIQSTNLYVPVSMLTDGGNVLNGLQIISAGMGWFRIEQIDYVPADDYTPAYTTTNNLSSITLNEGGFNATVTASISTYCGGAIGGGFGYSVTVTSGNTSVISVSGTTLTPVAGGDSTITVTYSDKNGNTLKTDSQQIHVASYAEQVAETLGENEFVNWASELQKQLLTDTTIDAYKNKTAFDACYGSPYYCYIFTSTDPASSAAYAGYNIEFAVKNVYSASETGYIKIDLLKQYDNGNAYIYKYGATDGDPVYTTGSFSGNTRKTFYVPIKDLINNDGVLEGVQIIMRLDNGAGSKGFGYYYSMSYAAPQQVTAAYLTGSEIVNWEHDAQLALTGNAVIEGYTGTLTDTVVNRVAAGWYNYQFKSSDSTTGRVQLEFANKNTYETTDTGYIKIGLLVKSGWGQMSYIYKYDQTSGNAVYSFKTTNANGDQNTRIYHYIPVIDLINSEGKLEGIQVVLTLGSSYGQIYDISYVAEKPS